MRIYGSHALSIGILVNPERNIDIRKDFPTYAWALPAPVP